MTPQPRVLVVDDDVDACRNLNDILTDLGYSVALAHNGPEALKLSDQQAFDLALVDLRMPGMDGITLFREMKRLRPETVMVLISAYATPEAEREATGQGAWKVLAKPVNVAKLLPLIDEALQQPLVLVVDDDADLCASLWDLLRDQGYRVSLASCSEEAAARLNDNAFCVVLVDLRLPGTSGVEVARMVRQRHSEARVVLITAHRSEMETVISDALSAHADAVCYKPFNVPDLLSTIDRLAQ